MFAKHGYEGASINEIAAEAGFSKGALYWNFASKEDLFFALLDQRIDKRIRPLIELAEGADVGDAVEETVSRGLLAVLDQERELVLLFHEYSAMAVRDPRLRERYRNRNAALREGLVRALQARYEESGVPLPIGADQIATAVIALADGLSIERLTDPGAVSEDLFGQILSLIFEGIAARAGTQE